MSGKEEGGLIELTKDKNILYNTLRVYYIYIIKIEYFTHEYIFLRTRNFCNYILRRMIVLSYFKAELLLRQRLVLEHLL